MREVMIGWREGRLIIVSRIGGLGHFGLMFAAALGAEVYAISTTESKKADAEKMGAKHFIAIKDDIKEAFKPLPQKA